MNWKQYATKIGDTNIYSENSVKMLMEMLIDDIPDQFKYNYPREEALNLREQLKAKWLGKE